MPPNANDASKQMTYLPGSPGRAILLCAGGRDGHDSGPRTHPRSDWKTPMPAVAEKTTLSKASRKRLRDEGSVSSQGRRLRHKRRSCPGGTRRPTGDIEGEEVLTHVLAERR